MQGTKYLGEIIKEEGIELDSNTFDEYKFNDNLNKTDIRTESPLFGNVVVSFYGDRRRRKWEEYIISQQVRLYYRKKY